MTEITLPNALLHITPENYGRLRRKNQVSAVIVFGQDKWQPSIDIFKKPFRFVYDSLEKTFGLFPCSGLKRVRMDNVGWYIRRESEKGQGLSGMFSAELVRERVLDTRGRSYEINCSQTFAISARYFGVREASPKPYFLVESKRKELMSAMDYLARRTLGVLEGANFSEKDMQKVSDFFYEDFTTLKHSKVSRGIGQEADSVFFP
jgi:hypothetical protein